MADALSRRVTESLSRRVKLFDLSFWSKSKFKSESKSESTINSLNIDS